MFNLFAKRKKELGTKKDDKTNSRLPKNASPTHYTVCFKPNLEKLTFEASVAIDVTVLENSKHLMINSVDLVMNKVIWEEDVTQNRQEPIEMTPLDKGQFELKFDPFLVPQKGQLRLNFKGSITDKKMMGFYRSKPNPNDNAYHFIAQFEPMDARRCLPCYDDPAIKAEFDVCLIIPKGKTVVGNMPIKARYNHKKTTLLEIVEFKRTPPISTFAVGFVVGNFDFVEARSRDDDIALRVYTPRGKKLQGTFALGVAAEAVTFLASYFSCQFPLPKLDFMVISDFALSSAGSWGLILSRDNNLLLDDESKASCGEKQHVALVICEEIVRQWIGNLVTPEWWNQLWVKSGVAMFISYICMEEVKSEYETSTHFVTEIFRAMHEDSLKSTYPLDTPVHSSLECEEQYDEICYKKGAALFRMLYNFIGEDHFRLGLSKYIIKYKFKNATTGDLWKCFEEASNKPISTLMNSWMNQRGYPMIRVTGKQDGRNRFIKITQEKFTFDQTGSRDIRAEGTWVIPITVTAERDPGAIIFHTLMDTKSQTIVISDIGKNDWIKFNPRVIGFYRTRYSSDMFTTLVHAIRSQNKTLEAVDRLNILDDKFAFLMSGVQGTIIEVLTLTEAFLEDDDYNVWRTVSYIFDKLLRILAYMNLEESFEHFGRYVFSRILERVGYKYLPNEHHHTKLLRPLVFLMMIKFKHREVISRCKAMSDHITSSEEEIPPELRSVLYYCAMERDEEDVVKSFIRIYKESDSVQDKKRIAKAFSAVKEPGLIKQILDFSISEDVCKPGSIDIISSLSRHKDGRALSWNFFKENIAVFKNRYGSFMASKLITVIIEGFAEESFFVDVTEYFKANLFPGTERAVQFGLENIRTNIQLIKRERNPSALRDYLDADAI